MSQKREYQRLNIAIPIEYKFVDAETKFLDGKTLDISAIGLCFIADESLKLKYADQLEIRLQLPTKENVTVFAEVRWSKEEAAGGTKGRKVGVKITDFAKTDGQKFIKFYTTQLWESSQKTVL